jgi:hypothetical protein
MFSRLYRPFDRFFRNTRLVRTRSGDRSRTRPNVEGLESRNLPAPLTWNAGPNLLTPTGGAAAAMDAGEIAVFGGGSDHVASVNVTDPTWQATSGTFAPNDASVSSPGVSTLPDGTLLVYGGNEGSSLNGAISDATQYDYSGNNTNSVASMHTPRAAFGFATDQNHLAYAIGGVDDNGTHLASMEAYTQSTNTWTRLAPLPQTLYAESAAYDGNGHIFTFGGVGANGAITTTVYEYTISTNSWSTAAPLPTAVRDSAAVLAGNGLIYVLGGKKISGTTAAVASYNPAANTWNSEVSLPAPVSSEGAVIDELGRIEILGGNDAGGSSVANVWVSQRLNQPDSTPVFNTNASTIAWTALPYSYQVFTSANPQATYSLTANPAGMTIDPITGLLSWTPTEAQLGGPYTVTIQASNFAGPTPQTYSVTVRQLPPSVPTGLTVTSTDISSISLSWNPSFSPLGIAHYNVYHYYATGHSGRGGGITYHHDLVGSPTGTSFTIGGLYSGSQYTYMVTAIDNNGNSSGYSAGITGTTLPDTVSPTLTVPANQTVNTTSPYGSTDPGAFTATGSDPGPGIDRITITYLIGVYAIYSNNVFPIGTSTVTVIASDLYGNSVSGTFTVTVITTAPMITVPPNQLVEQMSPAGSTDPNAFTATATDSVDPVASITYSVGSTTIDPSYVFPPGTTTVTVTATDDSGISNTASFLVTVEDIPPTLNFSGLPAFNTVTEGTALSITATGSAGTSAENAYGLTFSWDVTKLHNGVTTDFASGSGTGSSIPIAFVADDEGTFTLTVTATDVNGASTTSTQSISSTQVDPTTSMSGPSDGVIYQPRLFTFSATSPSPVDQASPFTYTVEWGDGNTQTVVAGSSVVLSHAYTAAGNYTIYAWDQDVSGLYGYSTSQAVTIGTLQTQSDPASQGGVTGVALCGTAGNDSFVVSTGSTSGTVSISINGTSLGNFTPPAGGIAIYAGPGTDTITFNAPSGAGTFSLNGNTLTYANSGTGIPLFNLTLTAGTDVENLIIKGGNTASSYTIQDAALATTILAGNGNDTFTLADTGAATQPVTISGGGGANSLVAANLNNAWSITAANTGTVQAAGEPADSFSKIQNITGGAATDVFAFTSNTASLGGSLDGGAGSNTLDFSARTSAVTVTLQASGLNKSMAINGTFSNIASLVGSAATDSLVGPSAATTWIISAANAGTTSGLAFSSFENLTGGSGADTFAFTGAGSIGGNLSGGGGANTLDVSGYSSPATINLQTKTATPIGGTWNSLTHLLGDNATSTLVAADVTNTWTISATNKGTVGSTAFTGFANLTGGAGNDTFKLANGAGVSGTIDGGGGVNTLDDSAYLTAVVINLRAGTATNVGSIANIQNATGGKGNDILVGNGLANVLTGNGGNNLLIGGGGAAILTGTTGSNLLIAGTTNYDLNAVALESILSVWAHTANSYSARVAAVTSSSYAYHLDATTVSHNLAEHLTGGSGMNLFFADTSGTSMDTTDARPGEIVISI